MIKTKRPQGTLCRWAVGLGSALTALGVAASASAQDYTASTTAAIQDAGESVLAMFFTNLPVILVFVVAISVTLWGIRWVLSHFGGRRR